MTRKEQIDIYNEVDNFVEENEGEVTRTEIAQHFFELGRNNAIEKACEWLEKKACLYVWKNCEQGEHGIHKTMLEDFRKAMKGEQT